MKRFKDFIFVSFLLHFLLVLLFSLVPGLHLPFLDPEKIVWVDLAKDNYEIVDILPPEKEEKPDESQFLGLYDSRVKEETIGPSELRPLPDEPASAQPKKEQKKSKQKSDETALKVPSPDAPRSKPNDIFSSAFPEDFYPDFKKGNHTYLNVLRFPDVQYFVRLKRAFKMTFNPSAGLREAYYQNRVTHGKVEATLGVTVDAKGNLAELFVFQGSGIEAYDQEVLRTVRASSPFSTPPDKLLDPNKLLRMS
ncbi:MAG: TonB family protein, partial [Deltaproteobacteria bacterium]|nr:TonB family protein [Deltaproteobacteria bacterium]